MILSFVTMRTSRSDQIGAALQSVSSGELSREPVELEPVVGIEGGAEVVEAALPLLVETHRLVPVAAGEREGRLVELRPRVAHRVEP